MSDQISVSSNDGFLSYNVQNLTATDSTVSLFVTGDLAGFAAAFQYGLALNFQDASSIQVVDQTSGQSYDFGVTDTDISGPEYEPGAYTGTLTFKLTAPPPFTGTLVGTTPTPCFVEGTQIATPQGPLEVQFLTPGDLVVLLDGSSAVVRWVGHRRTRHARIIHFSPGSLPIGPKRSLRVSHDHAMSLDGLLVPAALLVNGETITEETHEIVTLYHVELDRHAALLAEGAPAESYLDTGNRQQFSNCELNYDPLGAAHFDPFADLIVTGPRLDAIRASLRVLAV